jgi:hypothetical protein
VCVRERECVYVCVSVWGCESVSLCVCVREREMVYVSVYVCVSVCVCVWGCV